MSAGDSDVQAAVEAGIACAAPFERDPSKFYVVSLPENGTLENVDPAPDSDLEHPRRVAGVSTVFDVDSLGILWAKHAQPTSELFANPLDHTVTGIFNADAGVGLEAGHRDHRVVLRSVLTPSWKAWLANDGQFLSQLDFAEFLEDRVVDVTSPPGAELLELAQTIESTQRVQFKSAVSTHSGVRTVEWAEAADTTAGKTGQLAIPQQIELALQPFEGGDRFRAVARFRLRIREGRLTLGYKLERPEDILRIAFEDIAEKVVQACSHPVAIGVAPEARR